MYTTLAYPGVPWAPALWAGNLRGRRSTLGSPRGVMYALASPGVLWAPALWLGICEAGAARGAPFLPPPPALLLTHPTHHTHLLTHTHTHSHSSIHFLTHSLTEYSPHTLTHSITHYSPHNSLTHSFAQYSPNTHSILSHLSGRTLGALVGRR